MPSRRSSTARRPEAHAPAARLLTIALPKGRVLGTTLELLDRVGLGLKEAVERGGRRLHHEVVPRSGPLAGVPVRALVIRDVDLPAYVSHGAADLGVAGLDVVEEHAASAPTDLYRPMVLGYGRCRLVVAEPAARAASDTSLVHLRYGTKYPGLARRHLVERGLYAEIIELSGAVELAPVIGLCDRIVDLVESGETLRQHGLRELETILDVSACVIVNPASLKLRPDVIAPLLRALREARA